MRPIRISLTVLVLFASAETFPATDFEALFEAGPFPVETREGTWIDDNRGGRDVPWKAYLPGEMDGPVPVVVWSHGAGGSRQGGEYLGEHLASHGFAAFHIQHHGSDVDAARAMRRSGMGGVSAFLRSFSQDPNITLERLRDVSFAVDQLEALANGELAGRIDVGKIGMSGHSYGAITSQYMAGQQSGTAGLAFAEPRFLAAFAMSPSPPRQGSADKAFGDMLMPIFHLTGTDDQSPIGDLAPQDRQQPFQIIDDVDQHLLVLQDGTHSTFSGRWLPRYPGMGRHHELIKLAAVVFWRAYLEDDAEALAWLQDGGYAAAVGNAGTYEFKPAD